MRITELRSCVKVEVAVLGSLSLIVLMVSVDVKQHSTSMNSGAVWKWRWTSWVPQSLTVPTVSVDVNQH